MTKTFLLGYIVYDGRDGRKRTWNANEVTYIRTNVFANRLQRTACTRDGILICKRLAWKSLTQ